GWLRAAKPDVVCLQELKAADDEFPRVAIEKAGYHAIWRGQKSWNGVAILSRRAEPILTRDALPGDPEDIQSRCIESRGQRRSYWLHLSAERQSTTRSETRLQAELVQAARRPREAAA